MFVPFRSDSVPFLFSSDFFIKLEKKNTCKQFKNANKYLINDP